MSFPESFIEEAAFDSQNSFTYNLNPCFAKKSKKKKALSKTA